MISAFFKSDWALTLDAWNMMRSFVERDGALEQLREQALAARAGEPLKNARKVTARDGVASIPVRGPLFRHAGMLEDVCDATSYSTLRKDLQAALDDPAVASIVLDVDSPGGEVSGVAELADAIYQARGRKPITAYVGGAGASAAYWIASAADRIVAAPTAQLGSIGVIASYVDDRKAKSDKGVAEIDFVSSVSPHKRADPATDAGRALIQQRVDKLGAIFVDAVARHRGVSAEKVRTDFGRGDVLVGADAVAAGLADEVGYYEGVLADSAARANQRRDRMLTTQLAAMFGLDEKATDEQVIEAARERHAFQDAAVGAVGAKDPDEALGLIKAHAASAAQLVALQVEAEKAAAERVAADFRALLATAAGPGGKLSLGHLATVVPQLLDDGEGEKVQAAIEKLEAQTLPALLGCFADVKVSSKAVSRVSGFIRGLGPLPTTHAQPEANPQDGTLIDAEEAKVSAAFEKARAARAAKK